MTISRKDWNNYIARLSSLSKAAADQMTAYVQANGLDDRDALIRYAYALATKYGEGSAELACEMYEAMAEISGVTVLPAEPAGTATYGETAKAVSGSLLQSPSGQLIDSVVDRLVKQAAADTTMKNAKRDHAEWAWIPAGDTCAFCLTLASRGWQSASRAQMKGDHASHIHAHCDCQFQIRFNSSTNVEGYDPDALLEKYYAAEGNSSKDKINSMRRKQYEVDAPKIRAQKRLAYRMKTGEMPTSEYALAKEYWERTVELDLPQSEKEHIYEELDNNLTAEEKESAIVSRPIGNYHYKAIHKGHNQYKIYGKEPIENKKKDIVDEVLSEMFGDDWREYET